MRSRKRSANEPPVELLTVAVEVDDVGVTVDGDPLDVTDLPAGLWRAAGMAAVAEIAAAEDQAVIIVARDPAGSVELMMAADGTIDPAGPPANARRRSLGEVGADGEPGVVDADAPLETDVPAASELDALRAMVDEAMHGAGIDLAPADDAQAPTAPAEEDVSGLARTDDELDAAAFSSAGVAAEDSPAAEGDSAASAVVGGEAQSEGRAGKERGRRGLVAACAATAVVVVVAGFTLWQAAQGDEGPPDAPPSAQTSRSTPASPAASATPLVPAAAVDWVRATPSEGSLRLRVRADRAVTVSVDLVRLGPDGAPQLDEATSRTLDLRSDRVEVIQFSDLAGGRYRWTVTVTRGRTVADQPTSGRVTVPAAPPVPTTPVPTDPPAPEPTDEAPPNDGNNDGGGSNGGGNGGNGGIDGGIA